MNPEAALTKFVNVLSKHESDTETKRKIDANQFAWRTDNRSIAYIAG